jgi:hypothetical protein
MEKLMEIVAVVSVKTVLRTNPNKAPFVFTDGLEAVI